MKKLLVVLLALVTVAAFGAVNFSGWLGTSLGVTYDASDLTTSLSLGVTGRIDISASSSQGLTGFTLSVSRSGSSVGETLEMTGTATSTWEPAMTWGTQIWQKLYVSDPLTVTLRAGLLSRGFSYVTGSNFQWYVTPPYFTSRNRTAALAFDFAMKAGDLSDNLVLYAYLPSSTEVDFDVWNSLNFSFVTLQVLVQKVLSSAQAGALPGIAVGGKLDVAKALNISAGSLTGYAYLEVPTSGFVPSNYMLGVDFGMEKFNGSVAFAGPSTLGFAVNTNVLDPVTIGAEVALDVTNMLGFSAAGWASWEQDLISHTVSLVFDAAEKTTTVSWDMSVSF
ncbi:hypothetical protein [Thermotoga profunda]|uniref:hypothetical protein n=1 Tax=Thermotoga profunda TaxID=1508420 RepID=UPI000596F8EE|nr:hypothetical protein [Thermotoga profunda]